jgi:hypothetical protein
MGFTLTYFIDVDYSYGFSIQNTRIAKKYEQPGGKQPNDCGDGHPYLDNTAILSNAFI